MELYYLLSGLEQAIREGRVSQTEKGFRPELYDAVLKDSPEEARRILKLKPEYDERPIKALIGDESGDRGEYEAVCEDAKIPPLERKFFSTFIAIKHRKFRALQEIFRARPDALNELSQREKEKLLNDFARGYLDFDFQFWKEILAKTFTREEVAKALENRPKNEKRRLEELLAFMEKKEQSISGPATLMFELNCPLRRFVKRPYSPKIFSSFVEAAKSFLETSESAQASGLQLVFLDQTVFLQKEELFKERQEDLFSRLQQQQTEMTLSAAPLQGSVRVERVIADASLEEDLSRALRAIQEALSLKEAEESFRRLKSWPEVTVRSATGQILLKLPLKEKKIAEAEKLLTKAKNFFDRYENFFTSSSILIHADGVFLREFAPGKLKGHIGIDVERKIVGVVVDRRVVPILGVGRSVIELENMVLLKKGAEKESKFRSDRQSRLRSR